ncbi:hypothetical protein KAR91_48410 [Candidatus Pacearchaeota archaeon]|nr:hypothetical protein [Candidatus Pacearchaeota archaeon]
MLNIEEVKKEYYRIEELLNKEALSTTEYAAHVKEGYSTHFIKRDLGLSYNAMKKIIGATEATSRNRGGGQPSKKKIYCARGEGGMISISACIVGCNPAICDPCPNKQIGNIKASSDTYTEEEETIMRYEGVRGAGYSEMIAPYAER